ncbi:MAG TPA: hypothetical protein VGJ92_12220 [Methanocella sp.]
MITIIALMIVYIALASLPKHSDFRAVSYMSTNFATYGLDFIGGIKNMMDYPPTFFIIQGAWIKLGSIILGFSTAGILKDFMNPASFPGVFPLWGMAPQLLCLAAFAAAAYVSLKNKWLTVLCFGTMSFVSIIVMGQIDVFYTFLIFLSVILFLKALKGDHHRRYFLLSLISLGISLQFKLFGGLLLPLYLLMIYNYYNVSRANITAAVKDIIAYTIAFTAAALFIWVPFARWFVPVLLEGESGWLFNLQISPVDLPFHTISIWLLGYIVILYYLWHTVRKAPEKVSRDPKHFIYFFFTIIAWFFITVYAHPQWWILMLPAILLILDNFRSRENYVFAFAIMTAVIFYATMWTEVADTIRNYLPVLEVTGRLTMLLWTATVATLIIWIVDLGRQMREEDPGAPVARNVGDLPGKAYDRLAPLALLALPFIVFFLAGLAFWLVRLRGS